VNFLPSYLEMRLRPEEPARARAEPAVRRLEAHMKIFGNWCVEACLRVTGVNIARE
jgi:hypothetical protein